MSIPPVTPDQIPDINVTIKNWADAAKPPRIANTTVKTYIVDPAAVVVSNNDARRIQIAEYEPNRLRLVIQVIDSSVMLCKETPTNSPDISSVTVPGTGRYLPNSITEYILYGPDAWWINSLAAVTRVTVTKEYC
jgi:hypothetical protein